ncbi:MAG: AsmA family protein [Bacteroidales bacterium]|nr:AsmA family protein [Bacteroidales bacterium]
MKMKKGWKIALISVGSLLGLAVVVVAVALWLVFTPSQLTKIVNKLAAEYVTCETHFGRVNLTLFKTFPDVGLKIDEVEVVNPMEGAPSAEVAYIDNLTVGLDLKKFLKTKEVVVHQVLIDELRATLYVDSLGHSNFDIFPHSNDEDTTESSFSLDSLPIIELSKLAISNSCVHFINDKNRFIAAAVDMDLDAAGSLHEGMVDADVDLKLERCRYTMYREDSVASVDGKLQGMKMAVKAKGYLEELLGDLKLKVENGELSLNGKEMINEKLQASKHDLLKLEVPFNADLLNKQFLLDDSRLQVDDYALGLKADVRLDPMKIDAVVATDDSWQVAPLLELLPMQVLPKGMEVDGKVKLQANAYGEPSALKVDANVGLADGRFHYPKALPYKVNRIGGDLDASVDLSKKSPSHVKINSLKAHTLNTDLTVKGRVDDLLGDMRVDATLNGSLPLEDARPMIPEKLPLTADGKAKLDLSTCFKLSQLKAKAYDKMQMAGDIALERLDVLYDSIHVVSPDLNIALQLPARKHKDKMADVHLTGSHLLLAMKAVEADINRPDIHAGVNNLFKEQLAAAVELAVGKSAVGLDSTQIDLASMALKGSIRMDSTQNGFLNKYKPLLNIDLKNGVVGTTALPEKVYLGDLAFDYRPERCEVRNAEVKLGRSDFQLYGSVENFEDWLVHKKMLVGELNFVSQYTDVDELMDMFSGKGTDPDTLEQMRQEDKVAKDANPFIVPKDVNLTLHTHIHRSLAFGNDLGDVAGALTINDGTAILDQVGFVCKAATMQLTALYKSIRPNNLFCALDFHLLDIRIDELLDMIPTIDTLVPMLSAFEGNADFHLAGEGYLNARYKPKMSTLLGSAAISGQNLVVMDNNSIAQIAKLMQFKQWKDNDNKIRIDSLSVEMTCLRKEIEVFPFLLNIGKYQLCASGKHNLSGDCGYHVELLKNPLLAKVGVDVRGNLKNPQISLGEIRYADMYKPDKRGEVEKRTLEMKRRVREALENNVR